MLEGREGLDAGVLHSLESISRMFTGAVEEEGDSGSSLVPGLGGGACGGTGSAAPGGGAAADAVDGGEWPGRVWETDPPAHHGGYLTLVSLASGGPALVRLVATCLVFLERGTGCLW